MSALNMCRVAGVDGACTEIRSDVCSSSVNSTRLLRQADMRQFRICEKSGRHVSLTPRAGTVPENVVSKNSKILKGRVGKLGSGAPVLVVCGHDAKE